MIWPESAALADMEPVELLFAIGLGPWLTPLNGKVPILDAWPTMPPVDEARVNDWVSAGVNLGLRCGTRSGLYVVDDDRAKHGLEPFVFPPTGLMAASPTGGRHGFYRLPDGVVVGNSASKLAPHVDVRGEGGQVVVAPSIHPNTGTAYRWISLGEPGVLPPELVAKLTEPKPPTPPQSPSNPHPTPSGQSYADTALVREAARVRAAPEGSRNDTLNRAAFNLGQLVAGGALAEDRVRSELMDAAQLAGLPANEAASTVASGMRAGAERPRTAPERPERSSRKPGASTAAAAPAPIPIDDRPHVLVPGSHALPQCRALNSTAGEYREQGAHTFAAEVLAAIPGETLYRRAGQLGEIQDGAFAPVGVERLRSIIDAGVRLVAGKAPKSDDEEGEPTIVYRPCSRDLASIVLAYGAAQGGVRELRFLASHPVFVGSRFTLARPGWNAEHGVYQSCTVEIPDVPLAEAQAVLADMLVDFPFESGADLANMIGGLLTPMLKTALDEPVPFHLVVSPIERSGKTKLVEIVLGITITGRKVAAMQLGEREEEREKRIGSSLQRGESILHLDNLREYVDSPSLASLLTSSVWQFRALGRSEIVAVPNGLSVFGTGNNVHATGEIAKRIVPIRLLPDTDQPENRRDFKHPDLVAFLTEHRARHLGALVALVRNWIESGCPLHHGGFGSFERWTAVVGGIMHAAGFTAWLSNLAEWRGVADDSGEEHKSLVLAWYARHSTAWVKSSAIYDLAVELDLYGWLDRSSSDRAKRTAFGMRVMNRLAKRTFACGTLVVRIQSDGVGKERKVRLEAVEARQ